MLEINEKILASIYGKNRMTRDEINKLPYLKTTSDYGIEISLYMLEKDGYVILSHGMKTYKVSSVGIKYLARKGYLT